MTETITEWLKGRARTIDNQAKAISQEKNDAPCQKCTGMDFIQLFRNVVGEVSGSMQGSFSLFGGSVSGRIDGYTKTLPVLSCTTCKNERTISTWKYTWAKDLFWGEMHYFYFGFDKGNPDYFGKIPKMYLENPLQTREYMLANRIWRHSFYNSLPWHSVEKWAKAGFKLSKMKFTKKFLWWSWEAERWPTWEELTQAK